MEEDRRHSAVLDQDTRQLIFYDFISINKTMENQYLETWPIFTMFTSKQCWVAGTFLPSPDPSKIGLAPGSCFYKYLLTAPAQNPSKKARLPADKSHF
jgi:hypothetical protein